MKELLSFKKIIQTLFFYSLSIALLCSFYLFIVYWFHRKGKLDTWQFPMILAVLLDFVLYDDYIL